MANTEKWSQFLTIVIDTYSIFEGKNRSWQLSLRCLSIYVLQPPITHPGNQINKKIF